MSVPIVAVMAEPTLNNAHAQLRKQEKTEVYKVGGAVRDEILEHPTSETDWVVVGALPDQMLDLGFKQVGKQFPVFLHPETREEYALARTERKSAPGYTGFSVYAAPDVTLEADLKRRDLTINAMAMTADGELIDPYGGRKDLEAKVLRHVSPNFVEDPIRILRVARFLARYFYLGFEIADETMALMREMVGLDELRCISPERIWIETERALGEQHPEKFFDTLSCAGALEQIFPNLHFREARENLVKVKDYSPRADCRWAALFAGNVNKILGNAIQTHIRVPKRYEILSRAVQRWYPHIKSRSIELYDVLADLDAFRRDEPYEGFYLTLMALLPDRKNNTAAILNQARRIGKNVKPADLRTEGLQGKELGIAIANKRRALIAALMME